VNCSICMEAPAQRDGLCKRCRCRSGAIRRKYVWTAEYDAMLIKLYTENRNGKSASVLALMRRTGFPRHRIYRRAAQLGLQAQYRPWTRQESDFIESNVGSVSVSEIARILHRSPVAVHRKAYKLEISARVRDGYTRRDIYEMLGIDRRKVSEWLDKRWLHTDPTTGRVGEQALRNFLWRYPEMYSLKRVDEEWFKSLMFPNYGKLQIGTRRPRPQKEVA
jgi:methylphosphotriester-DNA--protein-cysteine methyltransferase